MILNHWRSKKMRIVKKKKKVLIKTKILKLQIILFKYKITYWENQYQQGLRQKDNQEA